MPERSHPARTLARSLCLWGLVATLLSTDGMLLPGKVSAQPQPSQRFEDSFKDRSRLDVLRNVTLDTAAGLVTILPRRQVVRESTEFRAALSGLDRDFLKPPLFSQVVDIDRVPGQDDVYLVTDLGTRTVFTYNADRGRFVTPDFLPGLTTPMDAFPFLEPQQTGVLKVLITDNVGRVVKVSSTNLNLEWQFSESLLFPSDAVVLPDLPEVLICDSGNNRLISVDTTLTGLAAIRWSFGGSDEFNNPVDVDVDPSAPGVYLVTDQLNHRVVLVQRNPAGIIFQFGKKGIPGATDSTLTRPTDADVLPNGNILIADAGNDRLLEVNRQGAIVYRFAHPLFELRDVDRIPDGPHLNKMVVAARDSARATNVSVRRLSYQTETYLSPPRDFGRPVDFDSLYWRANTPVDTRVRLQLRTVNDLSDTTSALWFGPTSTADFYDETSALINPIHDGTRYYQFRAFLQTDSRLQTPELLGVELRGTFFTTDSAGVVISSVIRDAPDAIITAWRTLEFFTDLSSSPGSSVVVDILDETGQTALASFNAGPTPGNPFDISPDRVPNLRGRQALRLRASLRTTNAFVTPKLLSWAMSWSSVKLGPSQTSFVSAGSIPVNTYRVAGVPGDSAYISVVDPNALPLLDSVAVTVTSALVGDTERIFLKIRPDTRAAYLSQPGLRLVFAQAPLANNGQLEVRDRDTLRVVYSDPYDPTDRSTASALVIRSVTGTIQIENAQGLALDSVSLGQQLFVRVLGETDNNLSPTAPDTIYAVLFDAQTTDREVVPLVELPDSNDVFNTGNFRNLGGVLLVGSGSVRGDGRLYVVGNDVVAARFEDPVSLDTIEDFVVVRRDSVVVVNFGAEPFRFDIAPNPYRAGRGSPLKLRAAVQTGSLLLQEIEIFNLAGDKVASIPGGGVRFGNAPSVSAERGALVAVNWWDLHGDDNRPVASGTYFAKFHALLTDKTGRETRISALQKFVIIQ